MNSWNVSFAGRGGVDAAADGPHLVALPWHRRDVVDVHAEVLAKPAVVLLRLLMLGLEYGQRLDERTARVALDV
jgi:hypothetical protein